MAVCLRVVVSSGGTVDADIDVSLGDVIGPASVVPSTEVVSSAEAVVSLDADIDVSLRDGVVSVSGISSVEIDSSAEALGSGGVGSVGVESDSSVKKRTKTPHT